MNTTAFHRRFDADDERSRADSRHQRSTPPLRSVLEVAAVVVVWFVLGIALLLFELHHLAFYALFGALGSFAAAVVALVAPSALGVQAGVAVGVAIVGVGLARPAMSRAYERRHHVQHVARGVHGGLLGQEAVTLDEVGDAHAIGHVRLVGERWLALSASGVTIPADTTVLVTEVRGTTLVVWPIDDRDSAERTP
jgi:membrane protein implicated in regulation of membrane protease activity